MYFYICHRGRVRNPRETRVLFASCYGDYERGDHVSPCGTEDFDGLTVIKNVTRVTARSAVLRGAAVYSNMPDIAIKEALDID